MKKRVLVTGVMGYVGSHVARQLAECGYAVSGFDKQLTGVNHDVKKCLHTFHWGDLTEFGLYPSRYIGIEYDAVVHCAGLIFPRESVLQPYAYWKNNVSGTQALLDATKPGHFILASTGSAFDPVSPYSKTKIAAEMMIRDCCPQRTIFRFFNVAGGNGKFRRVHPPSHLMAIAAMAAVKGAPITINGNDFPTKDGTCVRDYVSVNDVTTSIVRALEWPNKEPREYECLGNPVGGYSNLEICDIMSAVTGKDLKVVYGPRDPGDAASFVVPESSPYMPTPFETIESMCAQEYASALELYGK